MYNYIFHFYLFVFCGNHRDDLSKLEYVGMCIKESLRLFSPVIAVGRKMSRSVTFDGHVMPKGVSVKTRANRLRELISTINLTNQCRNENSHT